MRAFAYSDYKCSDSFTPQKNLYKTRCPFLFTARALFVTYRCKFGGRYLKDNDTLIVISITAPAAFQQHLRSIFNPVERM